MDERREGSTYGQVRLPNLKVEASLRSQQPREAHDITIITQCSLDRRGAAKSSITQACALQGLQQKRIV